MSLNVHWEIYCTKKLSQNFTVPIQTLIFYRPYLFDNRCLISSNSILTLCKLLSAYASSVTPKNTQDLKQKCNKFLIRLRGWDKLASICVNLGPALS